MRTGSLTVVGTGIKAVGQITLEAVSCMRQADKLLHLVADPVSQTWLEDINSTAESLFRCYVEDEPRSEAYRRITETVLGHVRSGQDVCLALYGHPGVFVQSSHDAIRIAREEGYPARMLPGISTEDCLFADLGIDPGIKGCLTYEATAFVLRKPQLDPTIPLILLQVGYVGVRIHKPSSSSLSQIGELVSVLREFYPPEHEVVLYEAAQFAICEPSIRRMRLAELAKSRLSGASTLYVPSRTEPVTRPEMRARLGLTTA